MTKQEYLDELRSALGELPADEARRACAFYEEMIDDRIEAGLDEQDAVAQMEPPAEAAARILDELPTVPRAIARAQAARRSGCGTVALWAAVIVGSPLWVSVLIAALAFVLCGVIMLCLPVVVAWVIAVAFLLCVPVAIFASVCASFAGSGTIALIDLGIGLGMGGAGLLLLIAALFVTRFFVRLLARFVRWAVSPFWKMPERPKKPLVGLSPVWRTACIVAGGMLAASVLLGVGGYATCGFSADRFQAEQDRVNAATSELMSDWLGWEAPEAPSGPAAPASPSEPAAPAAPASLASVAEGLACAGDDLAERAVYTTAGLLAAGLDI